MLQSRTSYCHLIGLVVFCVNGSSDFVSSGTFLYFCKVFILLAALLSLLVSLSFFGSIVVFITKLLYLSWLSTDIFSKKENTYLEKHPVKSPFWKKVISAVL